MRHRDSAPLTARKLFGLAKARGASDTTKVIPLSFVALGVVFGDIGTSPLYAFKECLRHGATLADIYGTVSLIIWSLILIVSGKYVAIILQADNNGEGGILALLALAFPETARKGGMNAAAIMTVLGVFGAALLYGDGVITPAISVLSAVEGLETVSPLLDKMVVPVTICILVALFSIQRFGTAAVGRTFGKVMLYGIAVTLTMLTTTGLFFWVASRVWRWSIVSAVVVCALFGGVEALFFSSNILKIAHGGWLPIAIGGIVFYGMTTWKIGREQIRKRLQSTMQFDQFVASIELSGLLAHELSPHRVRGTAVFLASSPVGAPMALLNNLKHNRVIHERNILLTFLTERVPYSVGNPRLEITAIGEHFLRVIAHFGFMEIPTIDKIADAARAQNLDLRPEKTTFFLGRETLVPSKTKGLSKLRRALFRLMSRNAENAADFFQLPSDRTVEIGFPVEL
jgi:K+ transporter